MATKKATPAPEPDDLKVTEASLERYDADTSALKIQSLDDIRRLSTIFIGSGMFNKTGNRNQTEQLYQAGVKIIAGVEFGIQPFAAMRGINIINGNAEMSANLMAAKVKAHPKYDYRITKWEIDECVIDFYEIPYPGAPREKWDLLGPSSFSEEDAKRANLTGGNWSKFARNMMFARAISNGVRIYTPDVFYGAPVYVEGEISGSFDDKEEEAPQEASPKAAAPAEKVVQDAEIVQADPPEEMEAEISEALLEKFEECKLYFNDMSEDEVKVHTREILSDLGYNGKTSLELASRLLGKKTPTERDDYIKIYAFLDNEREDMLQQQADEINAAKAEETPDDVQP